MFLPREKDWAERGENGSLTLQGSTITRVLRNRAGRGFWVNLQCLLLEGVQLQFCNACFRRALVPALASFSWEREPWEFPYQSSPPEEDRVLVILMVSSVAASVSSRKRRCSSEDSVKTSVSSR